MSEGHDGCRENRGIRNVRSTLKRVLRSLRSCGRSSRGVLNLVDCVSAETNSKIARFNCIVQPNNASKDATGACAFLFRPPSLALTVTAPSGPSVRLLMRSLDRQTYTMRYKVQVTVRYSQHSTAVKLVLRSECKFVT